MQLNFFQPQEIKLDVPKGRSGPRLWIRRIALWQDVSTKLRDIPLRQGVNIVWSPDLSKNEKGATPHGSGKSTFCRMVRYCLGERNFANEEQRRLMQIKLPKGFVGAEIIIDEECWVVTRPIGMNVPSRAVKADRIEDTFAQLTKETAPPTIGPVISNTFCANYRTQAPDNVNPDQVWDIVLAWLTRDQECRLDDVFDWRSKRSGSGNPAQELSLESKLSIVRLAIGALSPEEISVNSKISKLVRQRDELKRNLGHLDWLYEHRFQELAEKLSVEKDRDPSDEIVRQELIAKANEHLAKLTGVSHTKGQSSQTDISSRRKKMQAERDAEVAKKGMAQGRLASLDREISAAHGELGTEQARLDSGVVSRCRICHVSIDDILAKGCEISLETCDLDAVRKRIEKTKEAVGELETQQKQLPETIAKYEAEIKRLDKELAELDREFFELEKLFSNSDKNINTARELVREAGWFDRKMVERDATAKKLGEIETGIKGQRELVIAERDKVGRAIGDLEIIFIKLVASLMPKGCSGQIKLDGNGLHADIQLEGGSELTTAAVESFKIVAFDLAVMILAINEKAGLPSLLMHDSPREADLDASIYSNLFDFILGLEQKASPPPFQYIITTTTAPSDIEIEHEAIVLELSSTPAEKRLFCTNF